MPKQPFYKIGSAFNQTIATVDKGFLDPNRGKKTAQGFVSYTDETGKKAALDRNRTNVKAFELRDKKEYGDMNLSQYSDFAKKQKAHYRTTGVWLSRDKMEGFGKNDKGGGVNRPSNDGNDGNGGNGGNTSTVTIPPGKADSTKTVIETATPKAEDTMQKGLVREYETGKGFTGDVLDTQIVSQLDKKNLKSFARKQKKESIKLGATRREARAQKELIKAVGYKAAAGINTREFDASGKVVREADTEGKGVGLQDVKAGRARKKGAKATRRFNRLQHRMKDYEGHNIRKNEIGSQYYGDKDKFNQSTSGDQRDASRLIKNKITPTTNNNLGDVDPTGQNFGNNKNNTNNNKSKKKEEVTKAGDLGFLSTR